MADSSLPKAQPPPEAAAQPLDVRSWIDEATRAVNTIHISSSPAVRGPSVRLSIPLDARRRHRERGDANGADDTSAFDPADSALSDSDAEPVPRPPRRKPMRRDSLDRREALLKGKEGSRQRRRWENDRLLNNPWAQPPLPSDWEVHPTHPKRVVPYYLAPLWDATLAARREEDFRKQRAASKVRHAAVAGGFGMVEGAGCVPKELKECLRRSKAAKPLLKDLEEEVREFVENWEKRSVALREEGWEDVDSEEEEVVFVGRHGEMHDLPASPRSSRKRAAEMQREKLVFQSPVDDHGASFERWLVHSIATYYGLRTWSVTTGEPARREAYVGIALLRPNKDSKAMERLPMPLWGLV